jgi:imidazolonepropionase-like amidohydrolase
MPSKSAALWAPSNVLVRGNIIERRSASPIAVEAGADFRAINASGRVLMPSLIDAHFQLSVFIIASGVRQ